MTILFFVFFGVKVFVSTPANVQAAIDREITSIESILMVTAEGLVPLLLGGDLANVYDQLDVIQEHLPLVDAIRLVDGEGRSIYPLFDTSEESEAAEIEYVRHQMKVGSKLIGTIDLCVNLEAISDPIWNDVRKEFRRTTIVVAVLNILMFFALDRSILRPMQRLQKVMDDTASGKSSSSSRDLKFGSRELDALSTSFFNARNELKAVAEDLEVAKDQAIAANQAKSDFLANMSHELRTPLSGVLGITELLLNRPQEGENREMLEAVHNSGERLLAQLNSVLDLTRIEAGDMPMNKEYFHVQSLLEETIFLFTPKARAKQISLNMSTDLTECIVDADKEKLFQVVNNLVSNSIKFTEIGAVWVSAWMSRKDDGSRLHIAVKDTGIGVEPDDLDRIFEKFTQADGSVTRRYGGSGLGLTLCRRIIEFMGGGISAESQVGEGTTFEFWIPVERMDVVTTTGEKEPLAEPEKDDFSATRVLIVDDEPINRLHASKLLEKLGVSEFVLAENGVEALKTLGDVQFDVIYMDCHMPEMDGFEATAKLRELENVTGRSRSHVVGFTANIMPGTKERCLEAGMDDIVNKPLSVASFSTSLISASRGETTASGAPDLTLSADEHKVSEYS